MSINALTEDILEKSEELVLMPVIKHTETAIVCAGKSSRMGRDKALLPFGDSLMLAHLIDIYRKAGVSRIYVVINTEQYHSEAFASIFSNRPDTVVICNPHVEYGRTYSLRLFLEAITQTQACFLQNIDNPVRDIALLKQMAEALIDDEAFVCPQFEGKNGHPVLLGKSILNHLARLDNNSWILREELNHFKGIYLPIASKDVLLDLNTPEDWRHFHKEANL